MRLLLPVLLILCFSALAQKSEFFTIDSIPKQGVLLDKGWKYKEGDNMQWAKPDFNDSGWASVDPLKEITSYPEILGSTVFWLRLEVDVTQKSPRPLGLAINQAGASEIYVNGILVHEFGTFDTDPRNVKAYDPIEHPIFIPFDSAGHYILAVRYAIQPDLRYTRIFAYNKNRVFYAKVVDLVKTSNTDRAVTLYKFGLDIVTLGFYLMLFVLHFAYIIYQRKNRIQWLLTIYFSIGACIRVFKIIGQNESFLAERFIYLNLSNICLAISAVCLSIIIYRMARMRFDIYLYLVWFLQFIYCIVSYGTSAEDWQTKLLLLFNIYNLAIVIRVVRLGIKKGIKGFQTVLYGIFIAILGLLVLSTGFQFLNYGHSSTGLNELRLGVSTYLIDFIALIGGISIPVGLSLFMGIQSRETNLALSKQLNENEMLKNKAIEQEQEKQQILESQKEMLEIQVNERTAQLNQSLENLKATQNQLIQSEKLASLGELTAGIAHEIQNPLNFVNNFSELSNELIDEVLEERKKDEEERDESLENEILADLKQNLTKIHHHGKRASNIIRGMLQHSRKSSDVKELTDINALCDEYLRLSYHGLRAKDKSFNASFETHFDPSLPKTEVITQDIGRVILNLINNAFYAVNEKRKKGEPGYIPTVTVSTLLTDSKHFQIKIQDNGLGIPEHIKEKIFQPFFTTKPSGQGTGLGLSLAYDIITKGHGGTLEVNSTEGAGADFIIQIPI